MNALSSAQPQGTWRPAASFRSELLMTLGALRMADYWRNPSLSHVPGEAIAGPQALRSCESGSESANPSSVVLLGCPRFINSQALSLRSQDKSYQPVSLL